MSQPIYMVSMQACQCGAHGRDLADRVAFGPTPEWAGPAYEPTEEHWVCCQKCGAVGPVQPTERESRFAWNEARKNGEQMERRTVSEQVAEERAVLDVSRLPPEAFASLARAVRLHLVEPSAETRAYLLEALIAESEHVAVWKSRQEGA
jgi:hypothetical protein